MKGICMWVWVSIPPVKSNNNCPINTDLWYILTCPYFKKLFLLVKLILKHLHVLCMTLFPSTLNSPLANIKKRLIKGSLILRQIKWIFSSEYLYMSPKRLKKWCCGDQLMFNLGAPIGIQCYFTPKSMGLKFGQNNMESLWEHLNWTLVGHHNISFSRP